MLEGPSSQQEFFGLDSNCRPGSDEAVQGHGEKMQEPLSQAIEDLYQAFASYPLPESMAGCPYCHIGGGESPLYARPLRQLSWSDLRLYSYQALTTYGDTKDYRHFLPRILELLASDEGDASDNEPFGVGHILAKLTQAGWLNWPSMEQQVVRAFLAGWVASLDESDRDDVLPQLHEHGFGLTFDRQS